jgi:DNA-directed RNA polymerase subunit RPC12/RpoP
MEQTAILAESEKTQQLGFKPAVVEDVTLISPGVWTGLDNHPTNYSPETILKGFENSEWDNMNLFLDHQDSKQRGVSNWAGFVRKPRMVGNELHGDLEVWHPMISMFIKEAKAKFGVSMTTEGIEKMLSEDFYDYDISRFVSFSIVDDPACKISWINKALNSGKEGTKTIIAGSIEVNKELQESQFSCECIKCGHKVKSEKHCDELKCSECGGQMRRVERPGQGKELASDNILSKKEVKKEMEKPKEETVEEEQEEEQEEPTQDVVESEEAEDINKEASAPKESSEDVKSLSVKVDALTESIKSLASIVEKSLSAKETPKKELAGKPAAGESNVEKELAEIKEKLENTQKELASFKEEKDNSPDRKSLAVGASPGVDDGNSANWGMLGFLRESANLNY